MLWDINIQLGMLICLDEGMDGIEDEHHGVPYLGAGGTPRNGFHPLTRERFEISISNLVF